MEEIIDRNINKNEFLIRCLFKGDFKRNGATIKENIIDKDVFVDTRPNVNVSLLRLRYNSKEECLKRGGEIKKDFVGVLIFRKEVFDKTVINHRIIGGNDFDAEIISTPLDENNCIIPVEKVVTKLTPSNPGHADLCYLNPGLQYNDENPNTAIRRFSRTLFKECRIALYL